MDKTTLVTFLGKGRDDPEKGYRTATYRFPDGSNVRTSFFGMELAGYLEVSKLVILGTRGSQWGVFWSKNLPGKGTASRKSFESSLWTLRLRKALSKSSLTILSQ